MRLLPTDVAADIVIRIRPEAYHAPFSALSADIDRVLAQVLAWQATNPSRPTSPGTPADSGSSDS